MLHGYAQSGQFFKIKTRPLTKTLAMTLSAFYDTDDASIEFVYPDGTFQLRPFDDVRSDDAEVMFDEDPDTYAWWKTLNITDPYDGLEDSLSLLAQLVEDGGPFAGVIAFSQGAMLGAMFTAWLESNSVLGRREALQQMCQGKNARLGQILSQPPQGPLDFSIFFSGNKGTAEYYHGFYEPQMTTPSIHVLGEFDTVIPRYISYGLINSCLNPIVVDHVGVHYVPRDPAVIDKISQGIREILILQWLKVALSLPQPPSLCPVHAEHTMAILSSPATHMLQESPSPLTPELRCCTGFDAEAASADNDVRPRWASPNSRGPKVIRRSRFSKVLRSYRSCS